ncbi:MAG: Crp/Fnr family transcriptional regulator [Chloroflexi bacterium]|nr:Crp/Fnr family transcriptional regulator [Chloroflexota bacterium]
MGIIPIKMTLLLPFIAQQPLFSGLSEAAIDSLARSALQREYCADQIVQMEGDPCRWVAFVQSGAARVYRLTLSGREQVLANVGPGMHFNSVPALEENGRLRASVRALTALTLLLIPVEDYHRLLQAHPDLAMAVLRDFARRLDHLTDLVEDLSLRSVRGRLARFLLEQADSGEVSAQWTQDEIAAHLGTVRDVIGRTLRGFMDAGLVRREGAKLLLLDRARLEEEAES